MDDVTDQQQQQQQQQQQLDEGQQEQDAGGGMDLCSSAVSDTATSTFNRKVINVIRSPLLRLDHFFSNDV